MYILIFLVEEVQLHKEQIARTDSLSFNAFISAVAMMNHDMPRRDRIDYLVSQNNSSGRPQDTEHQCWKEVD